MERLGDHDGLAQRVSGNESAPGARSRIGGWLLALIEAGP